MKCRQRVIPVALAGLGVWVLTASTALADPYVQTNLVSDGFLPAELTDPMLVNPWGVSHSATSPFWTSNQGTSSATLYNVTTVPTTKVLVAPNGFVAIPTTPSGPQGPTGQVNNGNTSAFLVGNGGDNNSARFIFANLNGTISAWDTGATAFIQATPPAGVPTVYSGLAIDTAQTRLYAANDAGTGSVNVFDSTFKPANLAAGAFNNPFPGLVPFNVQDIGGKVYVTYALPGRAAQIAAPEGSGAVAVFDENGVLQQTLINGSKLASPWGIALAPAGFGPFSNDLLVGNFSFAASEINAFDPVTGAFRGTIPIDDGGAPGGLWALNFGIGGQNGNPNTLYFTDGVGGEMHGLFAAITPAPEPSTLALLGAGVLSLCALRRRRFSGDRNGVAG